jgi:hypothetical protein
MFRKAEYQEKNKNGLKKKWCIPPVHEAKKSNKKTNGKKIRMD